MKTPSRSFGSFVTLSAGFALLSISLWAALTLAGCSSSDSGQTDSTAAARPLPAEGVPSQGIGAVFTDITQSAGIRFKHSFGDSHFSNLVEAVGSGVAFLDYDGDGWMDLYLASGKRTQGLSRGEKIPAASNKLFRNRGDGTFEDKTQEAGVAVEDYFTMGLAVGDFDNDGDPDLYVCNYERSNLFRNNGDGTFTDIAQVAGVSHEGYCTVAATWFDYDRDGLLDLYVSSYIDFDPEYTEYYAPDGFPGPLSYRAEPDHLYRNVEGSRFQDVSRETGIQGLEGRGMSVSSVDFNGDGYPDVYVTNDATENFLLQNEGGKRFSQVALEKGVGYNGMGDSTASMGVDFGDFDGDGRIDLFVSDNSLCSLYQNDGDGFFVDVVVQSGIALRSAQFVGWGSFFFDFNNDGYLDILKVNSDLSRLFGQEDQIFINRGDGTYQDLSAEAGAHFKRTLLGRGAAFADYDNDGDLDVVISNINDTVVLLRNDGGNRNNWIAIDLEGKGSNRDAFGSVVRISAGGHGMMEYKRSTSGYLSSSDPRLHFGLGKASRVETIEIEWPSGRRQKFNNVEANQILEVREIE